MDTFSIRDLRERTGDLVRCAESGELAVIAKHGQPIMVAVPFDSALLQSGVMSSLAIKLFRDKTVSLGKASRLAGMTKVQFGKLLGLHGIAAVDYPADDLGGEMDLLGQ